MSQEKEDPLKGELSVDVSFTENSLSAKVRSRFMTAVDRLAGNLIDIPGASLERISNEIRAKNEVRLKLIHIQGEAAEQKLREHLSFDNSTIDLFMKGQYRKQENKGAIIQEALEDLRTHQSEFADSDEPIDEDWLNAFEKHAESASSDRFRKLWGHVLAGEIRKPKSFSLSTLRFMAELDAEIAQLFERVSKDMLEDGMILKPDLQNEELMNYIFLEEVGLLQDVNSILTISIENNPDGYAYYYNDKNFVIKAKVIDDDALDIPFIRVTRIGREVFSILPKIDEKLVMEKTAEKIIDSVLELELHEVNDPEDVWNGKSKLIKKWK